MSTNDQTLPLEIDDAEHAQGAEGATVPTVPPLEPLRPRLGTIVWGCILLIVGGIAIFASQVDFSEATPAVIVWSVIGFGVALVLAAIVTAIVRAVRRPGGDTSR
jgi:amino acid transporter